MIRRDGVYRSSWSWSSHFPRLCLHLFHSRRLSSQLTHVWITWPQWLYDRLGIVRLKPSLETKRDSWIPQECTENLKYVWSRLGEWLVVEKGDNDIMLCVCIWGSEDCSLFDNHPPYPHTHTHSLYPQQTPSSTAMSAPCFFNSYLYTSFTPLQSHAYKTARLTLVRHGIKAGQGSANRVDFLAACVLPKVFDTCPFQTAMAIAQLNAHPDNFRLSSLSSASIIHSTCCGRTY